MSSEFIERESAGSLMRESEQMGVTTVMPELASHRLLLVGSESVPGWRLRTLLETGQTLPGSWQLAEAASLQAALELLASESFGAVLLNLELPDSAGLETLLRLLKQAPETPVLVLSAREDPELEAQAVHYGAQDFLVLGSFDAGLLRRSLLHAIARQKQVNGFHHAALHDPLTHLANRNLFLTLVQQGLERRARSPEQLFAVLFLDLDGFKHINDRYGHLCGDQLLCEIAQRLRGRVRASDVVSRLAGDEFGILIDDLQEPLDVLPVVHRITQVMAEPMLIEGKALTIGASMGVALSDRQCLSAVELLENADLAMYQAKLNGKGSYCIFNDWMEQEKLMLSQLETRLKASLGQEGLLRMRYRPVISIRQGQIVGMETVIQCQNDSWQSVPFAQVLGLAGGSGMIDALNAWIFSEVHAQLRQWDKRYDHGWKLFLQLAPEQLRAREFRRQLQDLLLGTQLPPERFYLSLKESVLQHSFHYQELLPLLKDLHRQGFKLYLEDFGGSYTVLNSLRQIPIDMVSINLNALAALLPALAVPDRLLILAPVIQLAARLGMEILVDGVKSGEDMSRLQALEAVYAQGPFFSAPVSGKDAELWI